MKKGYLCKTIALLTLTAALFTAVFGRSVMTQALQSADAVTRSQIIINQVYGGGENVDTPISHAFVELFNTTEEDIDLTGLSLQYSKWAGTDDWKLYPLNGVIKAKSFFLVRGRPNNAGVSKDESLLKWDLQDGMFDQDVPEFKIDNKQYKLVLIKSTELLTVTNPDTLDTTIDLVGVEDENDQIDAFETIACKGKISKQKTIRRIHFIDTNNNNMDFMTCQYNISTDETIKSFAPRSARNGKVDGLVLPDPDYIAPDETPIPTVDGTPDATATIEVTATPIQETEVPSATFSTDPSGEPTDIVVGYVPVASVKINKPSGQFKTSGKVTIYKKSNAKGKKILTVKAKKNITVNKINGLYAKVKSGKKTGYIKVTSLKFPNNHQIAVAIKKTYAYMYKSKSKGMYLIINKKDKITLTKRSGKYYTMDIVV